MPIPIWAWPLIRGSNGVDGCKGEKGEKGWSGEHGDEGQKGQPGVEQGEKGVTGSIGESGEDVSGAGTLLHTLVWSSQLLYIQSEDFIIPSWLLCANHIQGF